MSDLGLYIAASGLDAQQIGMDAVSQDLANVNTSEYARTKANMVADQGSSNVAPGGVSVTSIQQITSQVTQAASLTADGLLSEAQALNQILNQAQSIFPEPNQSGAIQNELSTFWSNWDSVANNPSDLGTRTALVTQAQQLASALNQASNALGVTQNQTQTALQQTVTNANQQLAQIASLNGQIVTAISSQGDANSLIDQRTAILDQLTQNIGATYRIQPDGSASVYLGGLTLVQSNSQVDTLTVATSTSVNATGTENAGSNVLTAMSTTAGLAAGDTVTGVGIPAGTFVTAVNALAGTVTLSQNPTGPFVPTALVFGIPVAATVNSTITGQPVVALGGTAQAQISALQKVGSYVLGLNLTANDLAGTVNAQQTSGWYWAGGVGSAPSATGPTAHAGNLDTSGNPLAIFVNGTNQTTVSINASNIAVMNTVIGNPFFVAASDENAGAPVASNASLPATITINAGVNDQFNISANGGPLTLVTIAAGAYTQAQFAAAVQAGINAALGGGVVTSVMGGPQLLILQTNLQGPASSIQVTTGGGRDALSTMGMSTMAAAVTGGGQQNNGLNATGMAELYQSAGGPDLQYRNLIGQVGTDAQAAGTNMSSQTGQTQAADQVNQSVSGVSIDEETAQMLLYQHAYEASGKVVSAINAMFQSLLASV